MSPPLQNPDNHWENVNKQVSKRRGKKNLTFNSQHFPDFILRVKFPKKIKVVFKLKRCFSITVLARKSAPPEMLFTELVKGGLGYPLHVKRRTTNRYTHRWAV